jgi:hypothetical protein
VEEAFSPMGVEFIYDFCCQTSGLRMSILQEASKNKVYVIYALLVHQEINI